MKRAISVCLLTCLAFANGLAGDDSASSQRLNYQALPSLPDDIGVAGPIVGIVHDTLLVAGGANFSVAEDPELWKLPKKYRREVWLLRKTEGNGYEWLDSPSLKLSQAVGYGSVVTTDFGILVMGGESNAGPTKRAFLLQLKQGSEQQLIENDRAIPDLPLKCTAGGAVIMDGFVYVVAGQILDNHGVVRASRKIWRGRLSVLRENLQTNINNHLDFWEPIVAWPESGGRRMHCQVAVQHDGYGEKLYVFGGRSFNDPNEQSNLLTLNARKDNWKFDPRLFDANKFDHTKDQYNGVMPWSQVADSPVPITAGTSFAVGPAHIIFPTGTSLEILHNLVESGLPMEQFSHPGFPKKAFAYHTVTDSWAEFGTTPTNPVTTPAVKWGDDFFLISGELRPRVRTTKAWKVNVKQHKTDFGVINLVVVAAYLFSMLFVGLAFARHNQTSDHYFRGGKSIPWWVAGCSIFATMLSSITYMAVPAKAFAQDWVYWIGSFLILGVAPIAIYVALPFFRRLDATSAYEYLEKRFNRTARLIGSGCFALFHVFRMGIVLALAALALSSVTPLTPFQCTFVMGMLSMIYCAVGGIHAVVWTDTIQTVVLLLGAILCFGFAWFGAASGSFENAIDSGKLHLVNIDFGSSSFTTMAIWVVVLGGFGQNISSYTADQAVVQRYMTTSSQSLAARSIWLNAILAVPASLVFFAVGTALWMFYKSSPEKLDPTMTADRIMPYFISHELPIGLAGLVVAGIFAAAQSTVSTSMHSGATTIMTDFFNLNNSDDEENKLRMARVATVAMGTLGTLAGILFIDPDIKSLFDQFIGVLGIFLGVLSGLFVLGFLTEKANASGSLLGAATATLFMISILTASNDRDLMGIDVRSIYDFFGLEIYRVSNYLYAFIGIAICFAVGLIASYFVPAENRDLTGLTLWTFYDERK